MEINSVSGANTYLNTQNQTQQTRQTQASGETLLGQENLEASRSELDQNSTARAQQAFQVNITPEAQQLAAEANQTEKTQAPPQTTEASAGTTGTMPQNSNEQARQMVNIVA
ncbi:MAG: hypothetical protein R6V54_09945 [Desulfobacteraceae bacterium]